MEYETLYKEAQNELLDFFEEDNPGLKNVGESLPLTELLDMLFDRLSSTTMVFHVTTIAYEVGIPYSQLDSYLKEAEKIIQGMNEDEEIDEAGEEKFYELAREFKQRSNLN